MSADIVLQELPLLQRIYEPRTFPFLLIAEIGVSDSKETTFYHLKLLFIVSLPIYDKFFNQCPCLLFHLEFPQNVWVVVLFVGFNPNCPLLGPGTIGGVPLRVCRGGGHSKGYLRAFRRKPGKTANG